MTKSKIFKVDSKISNFNVIAGQQKRTEVKNSIPKLVRSGAVSRGEIAANPAPEPPAYF